jgi:ubiquinol-cytochrome c reductase iron-sulfur subunit
MYKWLLKRSVIVITAVGFAVTAYVFISSLSPSARAKSESEHYIEIADLKPGEVLIVQVYGLPLYIHRASKEELNDLHLLDAHVWNKTYSGFNDKQDIFVYWGQSTRSICSLVHLPKGDSRIKEMGAVWLGGYYDPCRDSSYDYAGRTIKTYLYSGNGLTAEVPNLRSPSYEASSARLLVHAK